MLHVLVALRPEAAPFVDAWKLRHQDEVRGFDLWCGDLGDLPVRLIRTGLGKARMAAGVGWLAALTGSPTIWLNAGIAGHGSLATGEVVLAHRVLDVSSGRSSYPPLVFEPPCETCELRTVDVPETEFLGGNDVAFDMEGSAFVEAALRFSTAEFVHCLKIVSDGPDAPVGQLDRRRIRRLAAELVPTAAECVNRLRPVFDELQSCEDDPPDFHRLLGLHHYTVNDRLQLRRLLQRRSALAPGELLPEDVESARRGKDVNRVLRTWLDEFVSE
ncbi:MAG: hypothetical protein MPN21_22385 [Thermoanaerobaculia bacterium]|nr:hypothetical protein [Thermoanaerobaculia bacterium]